MANIWNPWHGCHKFSDGCKFCYIHKGDAKRGVDTNQIVKTKDFYKPIERKKNGDYKIKSGSFVFVCFDSDFLIQEADIWRQEIWMMIKERFDLHFLFLTKRIERFIKCLPFDWNDGYDNVTIGCTIENQEMANLRLPIFNSLPIKHKNIIAQPLLGKIDLVPYLNNIELVVVGGEQDKNARILNFDWVINIYDQCNKASVPFQFRQTGTNFVLNNQFIKISVKELSEKYFQ